MKNVMRKLSALVLTGAFFVPCAYAEGTLMDSTLFQGVKSLGTDAGKIMTILSPIIGGAYAGYYIIRRNGGDEQDAKMWEKRAKNSILCGVVGGLVSAAISIIAAYF